jgi:hypothetical protein
MLGLNGGTAPGAAGQAALAANTVFWMYNVACTGQEAGLQACPSGRAGTAAQGRTVCPARVGARVCCVSAEQAYFAEAYGDGDDGDTLETLGAVQDDAQSFAGDIRDALQFARNTLDAGEQVLDLKKKVMGEASEAHGVKTTSVVARTEQQFGGGLDAKSVKPMARSAVKSSVRAINLVAPEVGIILDVAIGFFDALNTFVETGSLVSAAATFASSIISSLPIVGSIWGVMTGLAGGGDESEDEGGSSLVRA